MTTEWAQVDTLIRELGSVRAATFACHVPTACHAIIEQALAEATAAVVHTLNTPQDAKAIGRAHEAIEVVADVLATLDDELVRSLQVRACGAELRQRARELVEQAKKAQE